jgi:hypothetical protein
MRLYTVPFSYKDVFTHECLLSDDVGRSDAMDCVINTVYFLKMLKKEDAELYSKIIHDDKMRGLNQDQIIDLVFEEFTLLSKTQDAIIKIGTLSLADIKQKMEPGTCMYVSFIYKNGKGRHAVVIFKDDSGSLGVYDGQQYNLIITTKSWGDWLKSYSSEDIHVLYETNKRIRKSNRKDENLPLKRVRRLSNQISTPFSNKQSGGFKSKKNKSFSHGSKSKTNKLSSRKSSPKHK